MGRELRAWVAQILPLLVTCGVYTGPAWSQDDELFDFFLSETFFHRLADANGFVFTLPVAITVGTSKVHKLASDCEMHMPTSPGPPIAWPNGIVVEPPDLCRERAPGMPAGSEKKLREVPWPLYLDRQVMGRDCAVTGFSRIFTEHAASNADSSKPNHVVEIHPALQIRCGDLTLDMRRFLKHDYPGMREIKPESAANCLEGRHLSVRRRGDSDELREGGGSRCGDFITVYAEVSPDWVRKIRGSHSAIARGSPGGFGPFSLKTVPDRDGNWPDPAAWAEVKFPSALVVLGEVPHEEDDEHG